MKKQKFNVQNLSDDDLIAYYRKNKSASLATSIAFPCGSFLVSGLLSNENPVVFATAVTSYLAIGGATVFKLSNNVNRAKRELESRDLLRRVKFQDLKGSQTLKKYKDEYVDAFHKLIHVRLSLTDNFADLTYEKLKAMDSVDEKIKKSKVLGLDLQIDKITRDIEKVDRALDDYKFLLSDEDEEIANRKLPRDVLSIKNIESRVQGIYKEEQASVKKPKIKNSPVQEEFKKVLQNYLSIINSDQTEKS